MCLSKLNKITKKTGTGFKVFDVRDGRCYSALCGRDDKAYPVGKWVREERYRDVGTDIQDGNIIDNIDFEYPAGFHVFLGQPPIITWWLANTDIERKVRQVRFRKVVAQGVDEGGGETVVAKEIMVLPLKKSSKRKSKHA